MKNKSSLSLFIISLSSTPLIGGYALYSNFKNGIYPADSDIIAIPFSTIIGTLLLSLTLILLQHPYRSAKTINASNTFFKKILSLFSTTGTSILLICQTIYWLSPNHYPIFGIFLVTLCLYIHDQFHLYRAVSTPSMQ